MLERHVTEVELRDMLHCAEDYRRDVVDGRWIVETRYRSLRWQVIVEPDAETRTLVVITAYPLFHA
jgi:hypothetical protein